MAARARRAARIGRPEGREVWKLRGDARPPLAVPVRDGPTVASCVSLGLLVTELLPLKRLDFRRSSLLSCKFPFLP